jgi:predicted transglutaminase-like cysteine proteinase
MRRVTARLRPTAWLALLLSCIAAASPAPAQAGWDGSLGEPGLHFRGLTLFPKWSGVLQRFEAERRLCQTGDCSSGGWAALLDGLRGLDRDALIRSVERQVNRLPYVPDPVAWRRTDYWATPSEFLRAGGDCEDFAVTKYLALRTAGVPAEAMRVMVVWDRSRSLHHAVLLVRERGATLVLDNLAEEIREWSAAGSYEPIYSLNENGWWLYASALPSGQGSATGVGPDNDAGPLPQGMQEIRK